MYDELTGLGNSKYLENKYFDYLIKHNNSNYIMIDFSNFKKINDTYGHDAGDICLKTFADKLRKFFNDSLLVRLHGDEFVVVTYYDEDYIYAIFNSIILSIEDDVNKNVIPLKFGFNAGSVNMTGDFNLVQNMADYMMYFAKKNKITYQPFVEEVYQNKINEDIFLDDFSEKLNKENFSYYGRSLFDFYDNEKDLVQIYTRDLNGGNILSGLSYSTLRKNSHIAKFDMFNFKNIIEKTSEVNNNYKYFINIDYKSLLSIKDFDSFVSNIKCNTRNGIDNVILSIDLFGIESNEYLVTIDIINILASMGFKIRLDKVDNKLSDYLIEEVNPKYIKISTPSWKAAINNDRKLDILNAKINAYTKMGDDVSIIFEQVERIEEAKVLHNISPTDTMYSGNYYSKEKRLVLK